MNKKEIIRQTIQGFKGVIFDLDGTLIDSVADIRKFANAIFEEHGFPTHSLDQYIDWIGNGARKLIERALPAGIDQATFDQIFADYLYVYEHEEHTESMLYDGIPQVLDYLSLHHIPMAICTNKPYKVMEKTVKQYLSAWDFVAIVGQQDGKPKKPDPSSALQIVAQMKLHPKDVLFIGDSVVDIKTGQAAGMRSVCITGGYETLKNIEQAQPDVRIHAHRELLDLFNE